MKWAANASHATDSTKFENIFRIDKKALEFNKQWNQKECRESKMSQKTSQTIWTE